jgi:hypothetical protein
MSDHFSLGSADSISALSAPGCALCGNASRTSTAGGSLPGIGLGSRVIPTCAPLWPTPHGFPKAEYARRQGPTGNELGRAINQAARGDRCPCRCHTSTSSAADSPAKTSPTPARGQDSTGHARVFGRSTPDSFASYDPGTSSWRTSQLSLLEEWSEFSGTWPRSGMTRNGTAYLLQPLAPLTAAIGSGLSRIPTPTAGDAKSAANRTAGRSDPDSKHHSGTTLTDFTRMWPTPTARDWKDTGDLTRVPENSLLPRVVDRIERETWPTPKASASGPDYARMARPDSGGDDLATAAARTEGGGSLNPTFVEWLQGFPKDWTALGPVESGPASPASPSESPTGSTDSEASGTRSSPKSPSGSATGSSSMNGGEQ